MSATNDAAAILQDVRQGAFERGLGRLVAKAGLGHPPPASLGIRFAPLWRFDDAWIAKMTDQAYARVRQALVQSGADEKIGAPHWAFRAAIDALFSRRDAALEASERAVALDPAWSWGYLWRAHIRGQQVVDLRRVRHQKPIPPLAPEVRRVLEDFRTAERLDAENREVYAWRAQFLNMLDQEEDALPDLIKTLQLDPDYEWAYVLRAGIFSELHRADDALKACKTMCAKFPGASWAHACRGRERSKAGKFRPAVEDLQRAVRLDPRLAELDAWIGESYRKRGDYATALKCIERTLKSLPGNYNALVWKARLLNADWRVDEALLCLARAAKSRNWFDEHFYLLRGEALLKSGRFAEAAEDFDRALPSSPTTLWSPTLNAGRRADGSADYTLHADMNRLLSLHPENAWARAFRGWLLTEQKSGVGADEGASDLDESIKAAPDNPWARLWRGRYRLKRGWTREGLQDVDLAIALRKDYAAFWAWSGILRLEQGDLRRAEHDLSRALNDGPGLGPLFFYRGRVRWLAGDRHNSRTDFEEGFVRGPRTSEWSAWREEAAGGATSSDEALAIDRRREHTLTERPHE